jgi:hypothetical protein
MTRQCISAIAFLLLVIVPDCAGQQDSLLKEAKFLKHLREEKLFDERYFVLHELNTSLNAETLTESAWTLAELGKSDSAIAFYSSVNFDSLQHLRFLNHYLLLLFSTQKLTLLGKRLQQVRSPDSVTVKLSFANELMQGRVAASQPLPYEVSKSYSAYQKVMKKSSFVAGTLSMVLPGTGKMYYGQRRQGWNALFANVVLGIQAYESYRKAGIQSARFITFGSLFSLFYIGNIYGTVKGLKKSRADHKRQLHYEISNYYFADPLPYPGRY